MTPTFRRLGQSELLPRYIFAESLYARRRVLEIGAVASTLGLSAQFLSTRGARVVVAADADLQAVQEAQAKLAGPNLRFRAPIFDDFAAGSFDLVLVADLAQYVRAPELLAEIARLVGRGGSLMGGLRNPGGFALSNVVDPEDPEPPPTYGQLLDALAPHFSSIAVATQSPVLGYQLAFERGEGLQVDGSLAGQAEAAYYVVLASNEPVRSFDPTWVQLPPEPLAFTSGKLEDVAQRGRDWKERTERLKDVLTRKTADLQVRDADLKETGEQLEAAKEAVRRLTAQLETAREHPDALRERDELANRVGRMEAEVTVARERAIDAEGRLSAARAELEAVKHAQQDAAVQALAAQEQGRLERARREEVATQLEDARSRLTRAYEDFKRLQDGAGSGRLEAERLKMTVDRLKADLQAREADLTAAKERELKLADLRTQSLKALENLERALSEARGQINEVREEASKKEAERSAVERHNQRLLEERHALDAELERARSSLATIGEELDRKSAELLGADTELQTARAGQQRAQRDIETLASSERNWRQTAEELERQLQGTTANVQGLSDQLAQTEAARDAETARARRLEADLATVVATERGARDAAQAALKEAVEDRDKLIEEKRDLSFALADLERIRAADVARLDELQRSHGADRDQLQSLEALVAALKREAVERDEAHSASTAALKAMLAERDAQLEREHAARLAQEERATDAGEEAARQVAEAERAAANRLAEAQAAARDRLAEAERLASARVLEAVRLADERLGALRRQQEAQVAGLGATQSQLLRELDAVRAELTVTRSAAQAAKDQARSLTEALRQAEEGKGAQVRELTQRLTTLEQERSAWSDEREALGAAHRAELEALREATTRALDAKHAENEQSLAALRAELQVALEQQGAAFRASLDERQAEASRLLTSREADFGAQLATVQARAGEGERQRDAARQELETLRQRAEQDRVAHLAELEGLRRQLADEHAGLELTRAEAQAVQSARVALQQELDTTKAELGTLRASLAQVGGESKGLADARAQLEAQLDHMRQQLAPLEAEVGQMRARQPELEQLRSRVPELETELGVERSRATERERSGEEVRARMGAAEAELATVRQRSQALAEELSAARLRASELQRSDTQKQEELASLHAELHRERELRQSQDEEVAGLRRRSSLLDKQLTEARRDAPQTNAEISKVRQRLPELEAELEIARVNARNEVEAATAARRQAEELLLALRVKYGELQHEREVALENTERLRGEAQRVREHLEEATAENQLMETERARLSEALDKAERGANVPEKDARIRALERELASLKAENEALARSRPRAPGPRASVPRPMGSRPSGVFPAPSRPSVPPLPPPAVPAPAPPVAEPKAPDVVIDLEVVTEDDPEDLVLLQEEATDVGLKKIPKE